MAIVAASRVSKSFGAQDIFGDISVSIPHGSRIALVGPNGGGKTTLIRILIGLEKPSAGEIHRARGLTIGYLPQESEYAFEGDEQTVWDEMLTEFAGLRAQERELRSMEAQMAEVDDSAELMVRYGATLEQFELEGGYEYELRIRQVLEGLGFGRTDSQMPIAHLSGGQKTRALLAKLLLRSPKLLILDEPTNHLDIEAIEWLEGQLTNWPGALLIVSHDRFFLDRVVDRIWELNFGKIEAYRGNYSAYVEQRSARVQQHVKAYQAQRAYIAKEEDFIQRYMAGQRTKEAQGRLKRLNRLKRDHQIARPIDNRQMSLRIKAARRSGDIVLQTTDMAVGYVSGQALFEADDIDFRRTECAALIGPNGTGKTTFLKTILGQVSPLAGRLRLGASLDIGYFAQAHDELDMEANRSVLDELLAHHPMLTSKARNYLAAFLFTGDDVYKPIAALSGGERGRLALAILMHRNVNFLILDEPTNHLDIPSQEVLERVLSEFDGTILLVTHDRYLVARLATQVWVLKGKRLSVYGDGYQAYLVARERERAAETSTTKPAPKRPRRRQPPSKTDGRKQLLELEALIHQLEDQLASLLANLEQAGAAGQLDRVRQLGLEYDAVEKELERHLVQWAQVASD